MGGRPTVAQPHQRHGVAVGQVCGDVGERATEPHLDAWLAPFAVLIVAFLVLLGVVRSRASRKCWKILGADSLPHADERLARGTGTVGSSRTGADEFTGDAAYLSPEQDEWRLGTVTEICFAGVTGWTAPPIVAAIDKAEDLSLTAGVSRSAAGKRLAEVAWLDQ